MLPYLTGEAKESPRNFFFYISDDGDILAIRMKDWKVVLMEQRAHQLTCWFEPFVKLRAPKIFNLRRDPFERADENSNTYWDWVLSHVYIVYAMQALVANQIAEFQKFPPRQKPASFNLDAVMRSWRRPTAAPGTEPVLASPLVPRPVERRAAFDVFCRRWGLARLRQIRPRCNRFSGQAH